MVSACVAAERFRVGPPSPSGMRLVTDRVRSESFWIYPPFTLEQRLSGHEDGLWYFRPLTHGGNSPVSIGYPSFEAALSSLGFTQGFKDLDSDEASATPRQR